MADSTTQGSTGSQPVSDLQLAREYYAGQPLSPLSTSDEAATSVLPAGVNLEAVTAPATAGTNPFDIAGNATVIEAPNVSETAASNNTNPNITQKTDASGSTPATATGVTKGTPVANANSNTVHICDICNGMANVIAQARAAILKALKDLRDQILEALGLGDVEAQIKAAKAAADWVKKVIKTIQDTIQTIQEYINWIDNLISMLKQAIEDAIKNGLQHLVDQFKQCLAEAQASAAQAVSASKTQQDAADSASANTTATATQ